MNTSSFNPGTAASAARALAAVGYFVFPVALDKRPMTTHGFKDASRDPATVAQVFSETRAPLAGVATGAPSGVAVLDLARLIHRIAGSGRRM
jgi:hypothetical protein